MSDIVIPHDGLILDACCLINLLATSHVEAIIDAFPSPLAVADFVMVDEVVKLEQEPFHSGSLAFRDCIDRGKVQIVTLVSEAEQSLFIDLAGQYSLDDGEAMSAAIAIQRNWTLASDDRKIHAVIPTVASGTRLLTTPEIVRQWSIVIQTNPAKLAEVLRSIERYARYRPARHHPCGGWWHESIDIDPKH